MNIGTLLNQKLTTAQAIIPLFAFVLMVSAVINEGFLNFNENNRRVIEEVVLDTSTERVAQVEENSTLSNGDETVPIIDGDMDNKDPEVCYDIPVHINWDPIDGEYIRNYEVRVSLVSSSYIEKESFPGYEYIHYVAYPQTSVLIQRESARPTPNTYQYSIRTTDLFGNSSEWSQYDSISVECDGYTLTTQTSGTGSGKVLVDGIEIIEKTFENGAKVNIKGEADLGSKFVEWHIDPETALDDIDPGELPDDSNDLVNFDYITMNQNVAVRAEFEKAIIVSVKTDGIGSGKVYRVDTRMGTPGVIMGDVSNSEIETFYPTTLDLTATPDEFHTFEKWTGGDCGKILNNKNSTCHQDILPSYEEGLVLTAFFTREKVTLYTATSGEGSGKVLINGEEIPSKEVLKGEYLTLNAVADSGSVFVGWDELPSTDPNNPPRPTETFQVITNGSTMTARFEDAEYTLTVKKAGKGTGTVLMDGEEITSKDTLPGGTIKLTGTPGPNSKLKSWNIAGKVSLAGDTPDIVVTVNEDTEATATFVKTATLTVKATGNGSVSIGGTIEKQKEVEAGTKLKITAKPNEHTKFVGWEGGGCSGTKTTCEVTLYYNETVTATFAPISQYKLEVGAKANGNVSIGGSTPSPSMSVTVEEGTALKITAYPFDGYEVTSWEVIPGGGCSGTGNTCKVVMNSDKFAGPIFGQKAQYKIETVVANQLGGKITSSPVGINCGEGKTKCSSQYSSGTPVTLNATPAQGYTFKKWEGACTGKSNTCVLPGNKSVKATAVFKAK